MIEEEKLILPIEGGCKKNEVQEILSESVSEDTLKRCAAVQRSSNYFTGISAITDYLYLCSAAAIRPNILSALSVTCVINAAPELPDTPLPNGGILYYKVCVQDRPECDILEYFDAVANLIDEVRLSGGTCLLHCVAGISRSASLCLAYLMKYQGKTLLEAFNFAKAKRSQIRPNTGFFRQLIEYENRLFGDSSVKMVFNDVVNMEIPDVYDCEYKKMIWFQKAYSRNLGRH